MGRRRALNHRTNSTYDNPIPYSKPYLEGHRDLVTTLIVRITRVTIWAIGVINHLLSPPDPSSTHLAGRRTLALLGLFLYL